MIISIKTRGFKALIEKWHDKNRRYFIKKQFRTAMIDLFSEREKAPKTELFIVDIQLFLISRCAVNNVFIFTAVFQDGQIMSGNSDNIIDSIAKREAARNMRRKNDVFHLP